MAENTGIQWTTHTFNHVRGCQKVSAGCENCYADTFSKRNPATLGVFGTEKQGGTRVVASEAMWKEPLKWNEFAAQCDCNKDSPLEDHHPTCHTKYQTKVFCASLADVFEDWQGPMLASNRERLWWGPERHEGWQSINSSTENRHDNLVRLGYSPVTMDDVRTRLFALIDATPNINWQLLTKRPENIREMWKNISASDGSDRGYPSMVDGNHEKRPNVWLMTSCENQEQADKRIPELLKCRDLSPVLGLSCEPLLGPVDLQKSVTAHWCPNRDSRGKVTCELDVSGDRIVQDSTEGGLWVECACSRLGGIGWVIVGGESGPGARPCNVEWIRSIRESSPVPVFVKQLGAKVVDPNASNMGTTFPLDECWPLPVCARHQLGDEFMSLNDKKGGDWDEWPSDLQVRQMPKVKP